MRNKTLIFTLCSLFIVLTNAFSKTEEHRSISNPQNSVTIQVSDDEHEVWYYIVSAATHKAYQDMAVYDFEAKPSGRLFCYEKASDDHALWKFVDSKNGTVQLVNKASNLFLKLPSYSGGAVTAEKYAFLGTPLTLKREETTNTFSFKADNNLLLGASVYAPAISGKEDSPESITSWHLIPSNEAISEKYTLVWNDEFNVDGKVNPDDWNYEKGFRRNKEPQWYQEDNAICKDGNLVITARIEDVENPNYDATSTSWKQNRQYAHYTSSSLTTAYKHDLVYGRFEIKAKIPVSSGAWPAIWAMGYYDTAGNWPANGEIDLMEFYSKNILANVCWSNAVGHSQWNTKKYPFSHFKKQNKNWENEYHVWRMDFTKRDIRLFLDGRLLNITPLSRTLQPLSDYCKVTQPFDHPIYLLLNLALRPSDGMDQEAFPLKYYIDYVRFYQKK